MKQRDREGQRGPGGWGWEGRGQFEFDVICCRDRVYASVPGDNDPDNSDDTKKPLDLLSSVLMLWLVPSIRVLDSNLGAQTNNNNNKIKQLQC